MILSASGLMVGSLAAQTTSSRPMRGFLRTSGWSCLFGSRRNWKRSSRSHDIASAIFSWRLSVSFIFPEKPAALNALAARLAGPKQKETLSLQEKMALAMSCDRELRFQFLRDPNKQLHPLVLKNPRIGLEEVVCAAKLPTINPEALKIIADHPEWGQNPSVAAALVRNPKTPVPVAVKLVPPLAISVLKALARSQGRPQIVQAAKKHLAR